MGKRGSSFCNVTVEICDDLEALNAGNGDEIETDSYEEALVALYAFAMAADREYARFRGANGRWQDNFAWVDSGCPNPPASIRAAVAQEVERLNQETISLLVTEGLEFALRSAPLAALAGCADFSDRIAEAARRWAVSVQHKKAA